VRGPSMTPYLNENFDQMQTKSDMVLVSMWPYAASWPWQRQKQRRLERGMVVTFRYEPSIPTADQRLMNFFFCRSPANSEHIAIKRVVGLPGDRVSTREPCMKPTQIVPFNHVWLEGDAEDPRRTLDSNTYGPVSISLITGQVVGVLTPRLRWLKWQDWETGKLDAGSTPGDNYRQSVRDRVVKEAVRLEQPTFD
jgi:inner membrane protease subunit 2